MVTSMPKWFSRSSARSCDRIVLPLLFLLGCTPLGSEPQGVSESDAATDSGSGDAGSKTAADERDAAKSEPGAGKSGKSGSGTSGEGGAGSRSVPAGDGDASSSNGGAGASASAGDGPSAAGAGAPASGAGGQSGPSGSGGAPPTAGASGGNAQPSGPCPNGADPVDETCDAKDNDCDGKIDEGLTRSCGPMAKGECKPGTQTCSGGAWGSCEGAVEARDEVCDADKLDENCDGARNEGCACVEGDTQPCGKDTGLCKAGTQKCEGGSWSTTCAGAVDPKMAEVCDADQVDENCDGRKNEGCDCVTGETQDCTTASSGPCRAGRRSCNSGKWGVCTSTTKPSTEVCDNVDNDCDGTVDDNATGCSANQRCVNGQCQCQPQCTGKVCGADGCGGRCSPDKCASGTSCSAAGQCASTCGNRVTDPGEQCDDGTNAEDGPCPHCQNAFCGDGFIQAGVDECEQNAPGWSPQWCTPACKRSIYEACDAAVNISCPSDGPNSQCATWQGTDAANQVCGPYCETTAACPKPGGYDAFCSFAFCALLCNNGQCPTHMRCARNLSLPDGMSLDVKRTVDVCIGGG